MTAKKTDPLAAFKNNLAKKERTGEIDWQEQPVKKSQKQAAKSKDKPEKAPSERALVSYSLDKNVIEDFDEIIFKLKKHLRKQNMKTAGVNKSRVVETLLTDLLANIDNPSREFLNNLVNRD